LDHCFATKLGSDPFFCLNEQDVLFFHAGNKQTASQ